MRSIILCCRSKRRQFHADIAAALANQFPAVVENQPELLAHHYTEAGNHELAMHCWYKAGQRALTNSANVEAIAHFRKALELIARWPTRRSVGRRRSRSSWRSASRLLRCAGMPLRRRAKRLSGHAACAWRLEDPPEHFQALYGLWGHSWMGGKNDQALALANEFLCEIPGKGRHHPFHDGA